MEESMKDCDRIDKLERECRRLRRMFALLVAALGVVLGVAWAGSVDELVGKRLRLVDDKGNAWLVAEPSEGGGRLLLSDGTPFGGVELRAELANRWVALRGASGEPQMMLAKSYNYHAGVGVFDTDGTTRALLLAHPDGRGALLVFEREKGLAARFPEEMRWPIEELEKVMKAQGDCVEFVEEVDAWLLSHEGMRPETLEAVLGAAKTDPWGNPYRLTAVDDHKTVVASAGPDGQMDTVDDIVYSSTRAR
ncbi:MAG: hypothetical protein ACT4PV_05995 [Planctomycetaceae bacterium]